MTIPHGRAFSRGVLVLSCGLLVGRSCWIRFAGRATACPLAAADTPPTPLPLAVSHRYVGEFSANKRHGEGAMEFASGERYAGQWENDVMEGEGEITCVFQQIPAHCEGDSARQGYVPGLWQVVATIPGHRVSVISQLTPSLWRLRPRYVDGRKPYRGRFKGGNPDDREVMSEDKPAGPAMYEAVADDGSCYNGEWLGEMKHGKVRPSVAKMFGPREAERATLRTTVPLPEANAGPRAADPACSAGVRAQGVYIWADGSMYEGQWKEDRMHGLGTFSYEGEVDGAWGLLLRGAVVGTFARKVTLTLGGLPSKEVVLSWLTQHPARCADGSQYRGEWSNDIKSGQGILEYANGDR